MLTRLLRKIEAKLAKPHVNWLATFWINFRLINRRVCGCDLGLSSHRFWFTSYS